MEQTTIMHNKLIRRTIKFYCQRIAPIRQQKGAIFFRHHAKMCLVRRRLPANGCAPARFHSPADKIYESECVSVRVWIQPAREPSQPTNQPASVWVITLSGTVTLQLRQSKVACIYYTAGTNTQWMRYDGGRHSAHSPSMQNCALARLSPLPPPPEPGLCQKTLALKLLAFKIRKPVSTAISRLLPYHQQVYFESKFV